MIKKSHDVDKKLWVLRHPDFANLVWGSSLDFLNKGEMIGWVDLSGKDGKISMIESKYKPTYLNFIGSNSHSREMKKGVVSEI